MGSFWELRAVPSLLGKGTSVPPTTARTSLPLSAAGVGQRPCQACGRPQLRLPAPHAGWSHREGDAEPGTRRPTPGPPSETVGRHVCCSVLVTTGCTEAENQSRP